MVILTSHEWTWDLLYGEIHSLSQSMETVGLVYLHSTNSTYITSIDIHPSNPIHYEIRIKNMEEPKKIERT